MTIRHPMIDPTISAHYTGDVRALLKRLPDRCVQCCVTSSPYWGLCRTVEFGSGTTGQVAEKHERIWIGFDINPKYAELARERTAQRSLPLSPR